MQQPAVSAGLFVLGAWLAVFALLLLGGSGSADKGSKLANKTAEVTQPQKEAVVDPDNDPAKELFQRLFKRRRAEHLEAVKGLLRLDHFERQYKMVSMISEKIFGVIQNSRATLESSGYVPGSSFPQDAGVRDALASILENTALVSELVLRLPELVRPLLGAHHDWEVLLHWSLGFCAETRLLDPTSRKLLHLVGQELGIVEVDPDYVNPYRKANAAASLTDAEFPELPPKPKRRRHVKKGPQLTRHSEL